MKSTINLDPTHGVYVCTCSTWINRAGSVSDGGTCPCIQALVAQLAKAIPDCPLIQLEKYGTDGFTCRCDDCHFRNGSYQDPVVGGRICKHIWKFRSIKRIGTAAERAFLTRIQEKRRGGVPAWKRAVEAEAARKAGRQPRF